MEKNLGHATAYGYAKSKGYTGTEEEFGVLMASYASVAQDASQSASSAAESAQLASNEAQRASQFATSAHNDAETASNIKTDVESARDTTVDAKNATVEAKNISVEAKNSAISAKDTAESKAQIAEAWAVGQKDGTDVPSTDETYHNNAKYYSEQADIAKIGAESAQQLAQASATSASESASNASTSAQTASQAAQTATSKASEATIAATTATTKASEASISAGTASTAAQTATNKASEATTAATTATTKASEASQSATSASTAKINAETARDAAAQSASEAANSAIEAAQSAQSVDAERLNRVAFGSYVTESASGPVASFPDGADNIPMKDVLVHIEPVQAGSGDPSPDNVRPISGWTAAKVTRTGKNLASLTFGSRVPSISNGQMVNNNGWSSDYIKVDNAVNYTVSINIPYDRFVMFYDADKNYLGYAGGWASSGYSLNSFSHWSDTEYIKLRTDTSASNAFNFQLELGSTATDYEPYSGQTYDITFPTEAGTIYGGTLDVTTGELVVDRAMVTLDGSEAWRLQSINSYGIANFEITINHYPAANYRSLCNILPFQNSTIAQTETEGCFVHNNGFSVYFRIFSSRASTVAELTTWLMSNPIQLVYTLATPITYQLTPQEITSLLGENNMWADTGDSEVTYRVDPALLLDDELSEVQSMIAGVESSTVATKNYSIGDLVIVGDTLYEVTAAIASGETISVSKARVTTVDDTIKNRIADSVDNTLTQSGQAADAKVTGDKITGLKEDLDDNVNDLTSTIVNCVELYVDGENVISPKYLNKNSSGGKPTSNSNIRLISEPIAMPPKSTGTIAKIAETIVTVYRFDETDTLINPIFARAPGTETFFDHCDHIRVAVQYSNNGPITPDDGLEIATVKYDYANPDIERISALENSAVSKAAGKNLVDISASTSSVFLANSSGGLSESSLYDTSDYIMVDQNTIVFATRIRKLLEYNDHKEPIQSTYVNNEQAAGYFFTPTENTAFFRVSYYHADSSVFMAEYGTVPTAYEPYMYRVDENIHLSDTMLSDIKNHGNENDVLYGKKWVACGDSFTQGDFEHSQENYTFNDGPYAGQNKVYPYIIGQRTGMAVVNEAISGSTMTHIDGRTNAFSDTRYKNIPADANYITLKFGINDDAQHQNVPIGTIDDTTNTTFYGAWNVVLDYLIRNHLDAKIGIIITNGATLDIANATIAVAEKWGIPYLNEATGEQCSFVFRSNRTNIPSGIRNAKNNNWFVSTAEGQVNHHPNVKAHEFESTVVEAWLRSL